MHLFSCVSLTAVVMVKAHQPVWRTLQEARGPGEVGGSLDVFPALERLRGYWLICGSSREPVEQRLLDTWDHWQAAVCVCVCVCVCV